jgi:hypothetical protein
MLETLKAYNKLTAEGLLARTLFSLENDTLIKDVSIIENQDAVCSQVLDEISNKLKIKPDTDSNIQKIIDYLDTELEKSMSINEQEEKAILINLSNKAQLPTDLYHVRIQPKSNIRKIYNINMDEESSLISETVKRPDIMYHFNTLETENQQKDTSIFVKYFTKRYSFDNFYLLIIGTRDGLEFLVSQAWHIYNDIANNFTDVMDLLNKFVNKFGIEVEFRGEVSKLFLSKVAKSENDFHFKINNNKDITKTKNGGKEWIAFHITKRLPEGESIFSLFFVIDIVKYRKYLLKHKCKTK